MLQVTRLSMAAKMNTPIPPKYLSVAINDVTGSMIQLRLAFLRLRLSSNSSSHLDLGTPAFAKGFEAYHLGMSRMRPEGSGSFLPDHSVVADVLVREEPDEEEEDHGKEDDDEEENDDGEQDDDGDEGYSE
jgi:hypothetical protein